MPFINNACLKTLLEQNSGDTIVVLAQVVDPDRAAITIKEARLVKVIPAGLKLPEEKK
jgi:hypothetical protein